MGNLEEVVLGDSFALGNLAVEVENWIVEKVENLEGVEGDCWEKMRLKETLQEVEEVAVLLMTGWELMGAVMALRKEW